MERISNDYVVALIKTTNDKLTSGDKTEIKKTNEVDILSIPNGNFCTREMRKKYRTDNELNILKTGKYYEKEKEKSC